jgi:hypothetical protein
VPVLIFKSDWKATNTPSTPTISPNTSNQNFEIAILFSVVGSFVSWVLEISFGRMTCPPTDLKGMAVSSVLAEIATFFFK